MSVEPLKIDDGEEFDKIEKKLLQESEWTRKKSRSRSRNKSTGGNGRTKGKGAKIFCSKGRGLWGEKN